MVRRHGWQLPVHTFQVVAICVFFVLVLAFYLLLAPFLGSRTLEFVSIAVYSPVVLLVFILYVRVTRIDPAVPGILLRYDGKAETIPLSSTNMPGNIDELGPRPVLPSSASRSSVGANSSRRDSALEAGRVSSVAGPENQRPSGCIGGLVCASFVHEDCRKPLRSTEEQPEGEAAKSCTFCNVEVQRYSKHCRSCDKCVDGFDHHCPWLNNCVGTKNYVSFIALLATSLLSLIIEAGVGSAVFVRCFVQKRAMEDRIDERLGDSFSRPPFATIVGIFTVFSLIACLSLSEFFLFHMILIRKGITTYEYVVATRAMSEAPSGDEMSNIQYSPTGSAKTDVSGGNSLRLKYQGGWCTPPSISVDQQDEVIPHLEPGVVPSTVDPDAAGYVDRTNKHTERSVKRSAWKLAKLDANEVRRTAARVRASSSDSSNKTSKNELRLPPFRHDYTPSLGNQDDYDPGTQSVSSLSSPSHMQESVKLSPIPVKPVSGPSNLPRFISQPEKLMYTGESIFFGGPILSPPLRDESGNAGAQRIERGTSSNQFPVYTPREFERKPPRPK